MNTNLRWKPMAAAGAAALVFTFGAVTLAPQVGLAQDNLPAQTQQQKQGQQQQPGQWQKGDATAIDREALLADALGVTTDTLQSAYTTALNAALDQAVEQDLLTKTQADALRERIDASDGAHFGGRGFGFAGPALGRFGVGKDAIDFEALLADALGIKTEELQAAQVEAQAAAIDQAVTDGALTQEQADLAKAEQAFRDYVISQQPTYEAQLAAAVDAKAITQEQADLLLENQQAEGMGGHGLMIPGMGRGWDDNGGGFPGGMDGGRGGMGGGRGHGRGGFQGMPPAGSDQPDSDQGQVQPEASF